MDSGLVEIGRKLVLFILTMLLSSTVHEYAHALVADKLGDDTPRRQGRLTLSPAAHYDVMGTFIVPTLAILLGGIPFIGWARPVETNPSRYVRRIGMRNGHRLVAFAGPLSNLVLAIISAGLLGLLVGEHPYSPGTAGTADALRTLLTAMMWVNLGLFVLNLLPIPPLDGSRLLPRSLDDFQQAIAPYSFVILTLVLVVPPLRAAFFWPVGTIGSALGALFGIPMGPS